MLPRVDPSLCCNTDYCQLQKDMCSLVNNSKAMSGLKQHQQFLWKDLFIHIQLGHKNTMAKLLVQLS